jgi:p-aminobenzoyl-glutamate transporter AbgT
MIVSRMLNGMKEHDKDAKTALVDAAKSMIGYILGIFGSALVLVLAAEVFIPLFFSMGYNPDSTST